MTRWLAIAVGFFLPHLLEEALTGMHDDPIIVAAYAPLAPLGARHAAYLVFQVTLAVGLVGILLFSSGRLGRRIVLALFALALLAEAHHAIRALVLGSLNSGFWRTPSLFPSSARSPSTTSSSREGRLMLFHIIFAMGIGRILLGVAPFLAATTLARLLGFPPSHDNPTGRLMARLFGVRDVGLGVLIFWALGHEAALGFILLFNAATDFGDLIAIGIPLVKRQGIDRAAWASAAFALPAGIGWLTVYGALG